MPRAASVRLDASEDARPALPHARRCARSVRMVRYSRAPSRRVLFIAGPLNWDDPPIKLIISIGIDLPKRPPTILVAPVLAPACRAAPHCSLTEGGDVTGG